MARRNGSRPGGLGARRPITKLPSRPVVRPGNILRIPERTPGAISQTTSSRSAGTASPGAQAPAQAPAQRSAYDPRTDPGYQATSSGITSRVTQTVAGLQGDRGRYLQDSGYTARFDPNNNDAYVAGSLAFDPTNPFSRAALLLKKYRESRSGNTNSLAAMGQLNSGAYGRQQREINFQESSAQDAQQKSIIDFLARNSGQIAAARTQGIIDSGTALGDAVSRAPDSPLYDATVPAPPSDQRTLPDGRVITARDPNSNQPQITYDPKKGGYWHIYPDGRTVFVKKKK